MWTETTHNVLHHRTPGRQTVSVGIWIAHGAAHDPGELSGATHLVEHLTLRRCGNRDRLQLARQVDRLGGDVDAWTSSENMGLSVQTTRDALPDALGILRDALLEPSFDPEDVALEIQVAQAEYDLAQDDPGEKVGEAILEAAWGEHPLSRSIIGKPESIASLNPEKLRMHHREKLLRPEGLIIGLVGDIDLRTLEAGLEGIPLGSRLCRPPISPPLWKGASIKIPRQSAEQSHVRLAFPGVPTADPEAIVYSVLCRILGGGNSSRLFQKLREEEGLCYDIWATPVFRSVAGLIEIGWACSAANLEKSRELVFGEIRQLAHTLKEEEVEIALQGIRRSLQMEAETAQGRASLDIGEVLDRNRRFDLERAMHELDSVTLNRVRDAAHRGLDPELMASAICEG